MTTARFVYHGVETDWKVEAVLQGHVYPVVTTVRPSRTEQECLVCSCRTVFGELIRSLFSFVSFRFVSQRFCHGSATIRNESKPTNRYNKRTKPLERDSLDQDVLISSHTKKSNTHYYTTYRFDLI